MFSRIPKKWLVRPLLPDQICQLAKTVALTRTSSAARIAERGHFANVAGRANIRRYRFLSCCCVTARLFTLIRRGRRSLDGAIGPRCKGLLVLPKTGHTLNLEEPEHFNRFVGDFIALVEAGRWPPRDPRAVPAQIMKTS